MKPRLNITNPAFRYTSSANTDLRRLFAKVRRELAQKEAAEKEAKVVTIRKVTK